MKRLALVLYSLFTCLAAQHTLAQEPKETVYWYTGDFPPIHFLSGPFKNQGSGDKRRDILIKRTPEFKHELVEAAPGRTYETLRSETNACNSSILKTPERSATLEFSEPFLYILPNGIVTTRTRLHLFKPFLNDNGDLRLGEFLQTGKYRLGIIAGRSFGSGIDAVVKKHSDSKAIVPVPSNDHFQSRLLKLIEQDEYEAIVGYATELAYNVRKLDINERDLVFLSVEEEPRLIPSHVACSKSEFGKRVIDAINRVLADPATQREVDAAYRAWLDKETGARFERLRKQQTSK